MNQWMHQRKPNEVMTFSSGIQPVQFQSGEDDSKRYYFEGLGCQTETENDQHYLFMPESVESVISGYTDGQSLLVNHDNWGLNVGFGATVSGRHVSPDVFLTAYIMKDKTTPNGPFGNTEELIEAVVDKALKDLSVSGRVLEATCSICGLEYVKSGSWYWDDFETHKERCNHYRGGRYPVEQENGDELMQTCIVQIKKFEPLELSLVWNGSDDKAQVTDTALRMAAMSGSPVDVDKQQKLSEVFTASVSPNPKTIGGNGVSDQVTIETLTAEKSALTTQIGAKDSELEILRAKATTLEAQVETLESDKKTNDRAIKDGEAARSKAVEECVSEFAKTEPDTAEADLKVKEDAEKAALETLSLEQIYARTEGYASFAKKLYPEGRATKDLSDQQQSGGQRQRPRRGL